MAGNDGEKSAFNRSPEATPAHKEALSPFILDNRMAQATQAEILSRNNEKTASDKGWPPAVLIADSTTPEHKMLTGGAQIDVSADAPAPDTRPTDGQSFADRQEKFAHSRFAQPTLDGNAIQLSDGWEHNGYKGTCYGFQMDTVDHTSFQKIVHDQNGKILTNNFSPRDSIRAIALPLPEELIPAEPSDSVNIRGKLQVTETAERIPYSCTVERSQDGGLTVSGYYERPATADQIAAKIETDPETGMAVVRFNKHYSAEQRQSREPVSTTPNNDNDQSGF